MFRFQIGPQDTVAGMRDRGHHAIRPDGYHSIDLAEMTRGKAQIASRVSQHRYDDISDEGFVLRTPRLEPGRFIAAPDHQVGRVLDLVDLVTVDDLLIAGKINGA